MSKIDVEVLRHSLSHVMAAAISELYPTTLFSVGPAVDNGFYQDMDFGGVKISEADLPKIEERMKEIIAKGLKFEWLERSRDEAIAIEEKNGQKYKAEMIREFPEGEKITFCKIGDFEDLCKGPHIDNLKEIPEGCFKIWKISGAYWRGDEKREMLTRIYGVAFGSASELEQYLEQVEEAKKRDHRKLGRELDLFCYSPLVGSGLPMFTPRGAVLREKLVELTEGVRLRRGYEKVWTPHIGLVDLYKTSGHYEKFPELLKFVSEESGDELAMKPVSCPHHISIYASSPRSYRDLPIKYVETTTVYRDERKGELGGLSRVRAITQDDSHIFATEEQVRGIFEELVECAKEIYDLIGMKLHLRLSFRDDSDGYIGTDESWERAESEILDMAKGLGLEYVVAEGEAAMYGPKMDFMATDVIGREWQLATVQLDYALPERFELEYIDSEGKRVRPVMIHSALLGSLERFMSIFIEHTGGWFPFWCAPEQVRILTVNDSVADYVSEVEAVLSGISFDEPVAGNKLRYSVNSRKVSVGKKIKEAVGMKVPVVIVVGPKDAEVRKVSVRLRDSEMTIKLVNLKEFIQEVK